MSKGRPGREARRNQILEKKRTDHENRMKNPGGTSRYAKKIRLHGRTYGQEPVSQEPTVVGWRPPTGVSPEEEVRRSNMRFWQMNPYV